LVLNATSFAQENTFLLSNRVLGANNPSFFGFNDDSEVGILYKLQSVNDIKIQSSFLSVTNNFPNNNFSLALSVFREDYGIAAYSMAKANLSFIYKVALNDQWIAYPSVSAGFVNNTSNYNSLIFGDQLNLYSNVLIPTKEIFDNNVMVKYYGDYSAGIMANNNNLFFGLAISHLNKPKLYVDRDIKQAVGISAQLGYELDLNNSFLFLYSSYSKKANTKNFIFNQDFTVNAISLGVFESLNKSGDAKSFSKTLGASFRVKLSKFDFASSYSYGLDKVMNVNSVEVGIIYNFNSEKLDREGYYRRFYNN
jgi:type IX secretion system PorP/SprF family membrane protein